MDHTQGVVNKIEEGFLGQRMIVLPPDKRRKIISNIFSKNLYIAAIGYYPHASYHDCERMNGAEQYIFLYCTDGKGWIDVNGDRYILQPNTFFIIPKNTPHHYGSWERDPWSIYWMHFTGEFADTLYTRYAERTQCEAASVAYRDDLIILFNYLFTAMDADFSNQQMELICVKLMQLLSGFIYTDHALEAEDQDAISRSIAFMKKNLCNNYHIKDFASHVNYSVSHYSELFRRKTGYAPIQYFLQLKIQQSCQYLYFTKLSVKEISRKIGFDDPYYYSRMFKKQMKQSPAKYRKNYKT